MEKYLLNVQTEKGLRVFTKVFRDETEILNFISTNYSDCKFTFKRI